MPKDKKVNWNLPPGLHRRIKVRAAKTGKTIELTAIEALQKIFNK